MQYNGVNNKGRLCSLIVSGVNTAVFSSGLFYNNYCFSVAAHCSGSPPPTSFPPSFHCFNSVTGACSSYCMGAHGLVARICQPWEQLSSWSWLPTVEAPRCLRHPTSILAMQLLNVILLIYVFWCCGILTDHYHIFVGDLDSEIHNDCLYKAFAAFGQVT